ncbi:terminase small subunit [Cyclobacterium plantarum]|uniref:terminase small subunit n=1 Tax=Cyclobacterium plantarum TaxID=2716263 RepID=UPI003F701663
MKTEIDLGQEKIYLTTKELHFAEHYLGESKMNGTEAAKLAGYSEHSARQQAHENLTKPYIKKYIQAKGSKILEKIEVTQEKVLTEIANIAFSDITEFFNEDWSLKSLNQVHPNTTSSVKSFKKTETGYDIQSHDKLKALILLWELVNKDK